MEKRLQDPSFTVKPHFLLLPNSNSYQPDQKIRHNDVGIYFCLFNTSCFFWLAVIIHKFIWAELIKSTNSCGKWDCKTLHLPSNLISHFSLIQTDINRMSKYDKTISEYTFVFLMLLASFCVQALFTSFLTPGWIQYNPLVSARRHVV